MFGSALKEKIMGIFHGHEDLYASQAPRHEINIEEPESNFEEQFDTSPIGIMYISPGWEIEKLNMAASHVFGAQTGSLEGKPILALVDTSFAQAFLDQIHKTLASSQKQTTTLKFRTIRGQAFWGQCEMIPVFDTAGKFRHFRTVISDMSVEMQTEDLIYHR